MSIPAPSNPGSLLCSMGLHKSMILEADGEPVAQDFRGMRIMVMYNLYYDYCPRCGRKKAFEFWIDRS